MFISVFKYSVVVYFYYVLIYLNEPLPLKTNIYLLVKQLPSLPS